MKNLHLKIRHLNWLKSIGIEYYCSLSQKESKNNCTAPNLFLKMGSLYNYKLILYPFYCSIPPGRNCGRGIFFAKFFFYFPNWYYLCRPKIKPEKQWAFSPHILCLFKG